jgi:hypothetical protein
VEFPRALVYLPGMLLLGWRIVARIEFKATESLRWNIERMQMSYATLFFVLAAVAVAFVVSLLELWP